MPYIKKDTRKYWEQFLSPLCKEISTTLVPSGELNYIITNILLSTKPLCYEDYNSLLGILEAVKQEFYRRSVSVYEDQKIKENGDVY